MNLFDTEMDSETYVEPVKMKLLLLAIELMPAECALISLISLQLSESQTFR